MRKEDTICDSMMMPSTKYLPEIKEEEGKLVDEQTVLLRQYTFGGRGTTSPLRTPDVETSTDDKERRDIINNKHNKLQTDSVSHQKHPNNNITSVQLEGKNIMFFFFFFFNRV
jgi:hypothetical protein